MPSFVEIVSAVKKLNINLVSAIEHSQTADFVYNFVWKQIDINNFIDNTQWWSIQQRV